MDVTIMISAYYNFQNIYRSSNSSHHFSFRYYQRIPYFGKIAVTYLFRLYFVYEGMFSNLALVLFDKF